MRVIVTGGHGFIGRHACAALRQAGHTVCAVSRTSEPNAPAWDPAEPSSLVPHVGEEAFVLVHLAWDTTRSPALAAHATCVLDLARLCDYWHGRGLTRVVALGTAEEYGQRAGFLTEADPSAGALSAYGWGKSMARTLLQTWNTRTNVPTVWLRPFVVYGPGQQGNMVIPYAVRQWRTGRPAEFSDGRQRRDFVHVEDVAEAITAAVDQPLTGAHVFTLGTGVATEVRELLERLRQTLGGVARYGAITRRPDEPDLQAADARRAHDLLGWRARIRWQDGIAQLATGRDGGALTWTA